MAPTRSAATILAAAALSFGVLFAVAKASGGSDESAPAAGRSAAPAVDVARLGDAAPLPALSRRARARPPSPPPEPAPAAAEAAPADVTTTPPAPAPVFVPPPAPAPAPEPAPAPAPPEPPPPTFDDSG